MAETFEWPPAGEDVASERIELENQDAEPIQLRAKPLVSAVFDAPKEADPGSRPPPALHREDPIVALRRVVEQREAALKGRRKTGLPRSILLQIALVFLTLTAVLEGAYIARSWWVQSATPAPKPPQNPSATVVSAAEPVQRAAPPAPEGNTSLETTGVATTTAPTVSTGRLVIRSEPSGAQVFLDGRPSGVTPVTLASVPAGEHRILLKRNGSELQQVVQIEPGATFSVIAPLQAGGPMSGWIAIASPIELEIFEDGGLLGTSRSRQIMMPTGAHTLELVNASLGFRQNRQVQVQAGKVQPIDIVLPETTLSLNAQPWAEVWVDGKPVGQTPLGNLSLAIGTHEIVFRHPELGEKAMSVLMKAGAPTRLSADLRRQASK